MPLFLLAGGELVLFFLAARIAWWVLRGAKGPARGAGPGGGELSLRLLRAAPLDQLPSTERFRDAA